MKPTGDIKESSFIADDSVHDIVTSQDKTSSGNTPNGKSFSGHIVTSLGCSNNGSSELQKLQLKPSDCCCNKTSSGLESVGGVISKTYTDSESSSMSTETLRPMSGEDSSEIIDCHSSVAEREIYDPLIVNESKTKFDEKSKRETLYLTESESLFSIKTQENREGISDNEAILDSTHRNDSCNMNKCKLSSSVSINIYENPALPMEGTPLIKCNNSDSYSKGIIDSQTARLSLVSNQSLDEHCRICHCDDENEKLITPCNCNGSLQYVHESCLVQWMKSKMVQNCELCHTRIHFMKKVKPVWMWKRPTQRPSPVLWFMLFIVTIHINVISVVKDASNHCMSNACIIFYTVGCICAILATVFSIYFGKRVKEFFRHWININEEWIVLDRNVKSKSEISVRDDKTFLSQFYSIFASRRQTTVL